MAQRVRASGAAACLMFIQQTAATDWKVASEFLKLAFPEFFGTTRAREVPGVEAGAVAVACCFRCSSA